MASLMNTVTGDAIYEGKPIKVMPLEGAEKLRVEEKVMRHLIQVVECNHVKLMLVK